MIFHQNSGNEVVREFLRFVKATEMGQMQPLEWVPEV
jgi:hypothetical protein